MKRLITILILTLTVLSVQAGGLWDMVKNTGSAGTLKSKQYTIEVAGTNTRAYVFEVPEMNSICFITYSSKGVPAMVCKTRSEMK